jgi:hypothetical protein
VADGWTIGLGVVALCWVGLAFFFVRNLLLSRLPRPRVELSAHPLHPGERCRVYFALPGPIQLHELEVELSCEEKVKYQEGSDTRAENCLVHSHQILARDTLTIEKGSLFEFQQDIQIPPGAMHSFEAGRNQIDWKITVSAATDGWVHLWVDYPLIVQPHRHPGARS